MISRTALLASLLPVSKKLEQDLRQQLAILPDAKARLHADWQAARAVKRTAQAFEVFVEDQITQIAVAWILSAVFVRFLEDNALVDAPLLSGPLAPQNRLQLARDRHTLYFRENPRHSDVHYLKDVFALVGKSVAGKGDPRRENRDVTIRKGRHFIRACVCACIRQVVFDFSQHPIFES